MVGVLYGNAHLAKVEHRVPAAGRCWPGWKAGRSSRGRPAAWDYGILQVKELKLRTHVIGVAKSGQLFQVALQYLPRVSGKIFALGSPDVAEHPGHRVLLGAPRQQRKRGGIWKSSHIALVGPGKASMAEPSKPTPLSIASSKSVTLIAKPLRFPRMSGNHSRINFTSASRAV